MEYLEKSEVELDDDSFDIYICDEDEHNKVFLTKEEALELAEEIRIRFKKS